MTVQEQKALFTSFHRQNTARLQSYVRHFIRSYRAPRELHDDLMQAALCEAYVAMAHWRADGGKTLFNWCAGPMRRAMLRCYRASCGSRAYGTDALPRWAELKAAHGAKKAEDLEGYIDLHVALASDPKPQQIVRLIMVALSVSNGAELGRLDGIHKMTVSEHLSKARQRLKTALTA